MKKKLKNSFLGMDEFGSSVNFLVEGNKQFKTATGAVITIAISLIFMTFGVTKFLLLYGIQDTKHISLLKENIIPTDQSFNMSSTNFNLAIQIRPVDWTNPQANLSQYL